MSYNKNMEKQFTAQYTQDAENELRSLDKQNQKESCAPLQSLKN